MPRDNYCDRNNPATRGLPQTPIYGKGVKIAPCIPGKQTTPYEQKNYLPELLPLEAYDLVVVLLSGGKDSIACLLKLLELGVPPEKIECWHHDIDGGHPTRRMDWPVTQSYIKVLCAHLGVRLRVSWRIGGFFGEVYRIGASLPVAYEDNGQEKLCPLSEKQLRSAELRAAILGEDSPAYEELASYGYRMKFPAKVADLERRWCSSSLKISVGDTVLRNLETLKDLGQCGKLPAKSSCEHGRWCSPTLKRIVGDSVLRNLASIGSRRKFPAKGNCQQGRWCSGTLKASVEQSVTADLQRVDDGIRILVVSGERRDESTARSKYNEMELHRTNAEKKAHRTVHLWRPVIDWSERDVWEPMRRHCITAHPCYAAGWNRCSCMMCVFSLPRHLAGIRELFPKDYEQLRQDEIRLGFTLDNKKSLDDYVGDAISCVDHSADAAIQQLQSGLFKANDIYTPVTQWEFPSGAFCGVLGGPC